MNKRMGIFPTMITPYTKEGKVDFNGVDELVKWYKKKGCDSIFAVCQSSEIFYLSLEERVSVAKRVVNDVAALNESDKSKKSMKVVVSGHVSDSFEKQVEELNAMAQTGADALILITNRMDAENTSEQKWISDLHKLVGAIRSDIPLGLYECPKPYKRVLSAKMIEACAETGRFAFIKDTCCDASVIKERMDLLKNSDIGLYNANAQTFLETLRYGCDGYCGVMANFHPELYKWLFLNYQNSEYAEIVQSFLCLAAFTEGLAYPATAKYYLGKYEGLPIETFSRSVDDSLVNEYAKSCLGQMKTLGDYLKKQIGLDE